MVLKNNANLLSTAPKYKKTVQGLMGKKIKQANMYLIVYTQA